MSSSSVWVQLYYEGKNEPVGDSVQIYQSDLAAGREWNIASLKEAAKATSKFDLDAPLNLMFVYPPKSSGDEKKYNAGKKLEEVIDGLKDTTPPTSEDHPLILVAPAPQQPQQQPDGEKKRRLEDLLFYHRAAIETGTSKSSKLAKVKKLPDGSKRCFLCGTSGTATDKIEASHILQKQDIYATGGEEALLTLDALKNWSAGQGWKRPFIIHDAMNLIWLCHTHNLAFDRHEFGLSLGGLDNRVVFYSCLDDYAELVAAANARLADPAQPFFDMSYVSRRAIGMRLCKAQSAGYFADHNNPDAWKAVVALSAAASLKHENGSDDEDEK